MLYDNPLALFVVKMHIRHITQLKHRDTIIGNERNTTGIKTFKLSYRDHDAFFAKRFQFMVVAVAEEKNNIKIRVETVLELNVFRNSEVIVPAG